MLILSHVGYLLSQLWKMTTLDICTTEMKSVVALQAGCLQCATQKRLLNIRVGCAGATVVD